MSGMPGFHSPYIRALIRPLVENKGRINHVLKVTCERWAKRFTEALLKEGNLVKFGKSAVKS